MDVCCRVISINSMFLWQFMDFDTELSSHPPPSPQLTSPRNRESPIKGLRKYQSSGKPSSREVLKSGSVVFPVGILGPWDCNRRITFERDTLPKLRGHEEKYDQLSLTNGPFCVAFISGCYEMK